MDQQALVSNIQTSSPLKLVMMDYLTVEESLSGIKYFLVIMDHFAKFVVVVPSPGPNGADSCTGIVEEFNRGIWLPNATILG